MEVYGNLPPKSHICDSPQIMQEFFQDNLDPRRILTGVSTKHLSKSSSRNFQKGYTPTSSNDRLSGVVKRICRKKIYAPDFVFEILILIWGTRQNWSIDWALSNITIQVFEFLHRWQHCSIIIKRAYYMAVLYADSIKF